jgi:hypothetical protein
MSVTIRRKYGTENSFRLRRKIRILYVFCTRFQKPGTPQRTGRAWDRYSVDWKRRRSSGKRERVCTIRIRTPTSTTGEYLPTAVMPTHCSTRYYFRMANAEKPRTCRTKDCAALASIKTFHQSSNRVIVWPLVTTALTSRTLGVRASAENNMPLTSAPKIVEWTVYYKWPEIGKYLYQLPQTREGSPALVWN